MREAREAAEETHMLTSRQHTAEHSVSEIDTMNVAADTATHPSAPLDLTFHRWVVSSDLSSSSAVTQRSNTGSLRLLPGSSKQAPRPTMPSLYGSAGFALGSVVFVHGGVGFSLGRGRSGGREPHHRQRTTNTLYRARLSGNNTSQLKPWHLLRPEAESEQLPSLAFHVALPLARGIDGRWRVALVAAAYRRPPADPFEIVPPPFRLHLCCWLLSLPPRMQRVRVDSVCTNWSVELVSVHTRLLR